jgi:alpha-glucosidase
VLSVVKYYNWLITNWFISSISNKLIMKRTLRIFFTFILLPCLIISCSSVNNYKISSPDGRIELTVSSSDTSGISFSVWFDNIRVLKDCPFQLIFKGMPSFSRNLKISGSGITVIDETWERVWGKRRQVRNNCTEMELEFTEKGDRNRQIILIFRAYNDGIAFRYEIPQQDAISEFSIVRENSIFRFTGDHRIWATHWNDFHTSQEHEFIEGHLSDLKMDDILGTPLLVQADTNIWVSLLEANLTDWAGMCLAAGPEQYAVTTRLSPLPDEPDVVVKSTAPGHSPWRVIMLGDHPGKLIESDIIHNLNEPCALEDVSWIKPGKSAWDWWWNDGYAPDKGRKLGPDTESHKYFIDFASEMGWPYQLVDWYWYGPPFTSMETFGPNPVSDITIYTDECNVPEIVKYAASKGVKTILWLEWHHVNKQMDEAFALYEKWGVAGVKIDFMDRNDQEMVNFYYRVVKKAAEHHLLVDFHGAYMPTGIERTWPNFITREGVLGNEYNKWSDRITPDHCLTIPFTRMLGGHMDFTPGGFVHGNRETFRIAQQTGLPYTMVRGTRCFQLAMFVVYESALQVICDSPYNYRKSPDGLDFLKMVPTTWDETKVITGQVGDFIAVARRSGEEWYIGIMTDRTPRNLEISLDFLDEGRYHAVIWSDTPESEKFPERLSKSEMNLTNKDIHLARLASEGGQVIYLVPEK